ncbi:uncharacterized protein LY89DRAFT_776994 [Mollisia scopiformis]|uniref:Uncharacterized protein n=1 Tax=Mollisia scopiformis TaxID=149040 RepID=A0A194XSC1_MOLSC|nr:uncharacterized protein LY89DRAFT_776994 [Mollisia scopiformis]KUJ23200.1 hypothetical protein LY89DRAFT_776994 [Mollisia scopiformis]
MQEDKSKQHTDPCPRFAIIARCLELLLPFLCIWIWTLDPKGASRKLLWSEGASRLLNSDPSNAIYFYSNQTETPEVPYIWSEKLANANVMVIMGTSIIVVLRAAFHTSNRFNTKRIDLTLNIILLPLWIACLVGQQSSDYSDPHHRSRFPWYLVSSCSSAHLGARSACRNAQLTFAFTLLMALLYGTWVMKTIVSEIRDFINRRRYQQIIELP